MTYFPSNNYNKGFTNCQVLDKLFEEFLNLKEAEKIAFLQMIFVFFENKKAFWKIWKLIPFPFEKIFSFFAFYFSIFSI
jgi:hypothetical protein